MSVKGGIRKIPYSFLTKNKKGYCRGLFTTN